MAYDGDADADGWVAGVKVVNTGRLRLLCKVGGDCGWQNGSVINVQKKQGLMSISAVLGIV